MRGAFLRASGARFFAVAATLTSGLVNLKLYGHFLTPDIYGVVVVALQIISYLPMLDGGFRMAVNRRLLATGESSERRALTVFSQEVYSWLLVLGLMAGAILMAGYASFPRSHVSGHSTALLFLAMGCSGALSMFAGAQAGLLLGLGRQAEMAIISGINALLGTGVLAAALWTNTGLWAFPISQLAIAAATYGLAIGLLRPRRNSIPLLKFSLGEKFWCLFRDIRREAWPAFRSQTSIVLLFSSDLILASFFCKPAEVAIYGVASRVLGIIRSFLQTFNEASWPFIATHAQKFHRLQDWITHVNSLLYGLAGGVLVALLPGFITWYMGSSWQLPAILCWLLVARFLVIGISAPASYYLIGKGDFRNIARHTEYELISGVTLSLLLGMSHGLLGIAVGYLLGTAGGTLVPFWWHYAKLRERTLTSLLRTAWALTLLGFIPGWLCARFLSAYLPFPHQ